MKPPICRYPPPGGILSDYGDSQMSQGYILGFVVRNETVAIIQPVGGHHLLEVPISRVVMGA